MRAILTAASLILILGACTTTPTDEQTPAPVTDSKPPVARAGDSVAKVDVTKQPAGQDLLKTGILGKRSIYFDYDKFEVKDEYRPLVEAHARYLRENPSAKMLIQGNADERGGREYNVGLGQRRSDSVKKMLQLLGAKEAQVESVSLGEEKPVCSDHSEECWAKNRRGDILYAPEF
jgi:peptidoglycan-associated lipoprotein